jgi:hypothetical protein
LYAILIQYAVALRDLSMPNANSVVGCCLVGSVALESHEAVFRAVAGAAKALAADPAGSTS